MALRVYDSLQADQCLIVDLIFVQQFGVVGEVVQKPAQLPHGSRS